MLGDLGECDPTLFFSGGFDVVPKSYSGIRLRTDLPYVVIRFRETTTSSKGAILQVLRPRKNVRWQIGSALRAPLGSSSVLGVK